MALLVKFSAQKDDSLPDLGVSLLQKAVIECAPQLDAESWTVAVQALSQSSSPETDSELFRSANALPD